MVSLLVGFIKCVVSIIVFFTTKLITPILMEFSYNYRQQQWWAFGFGWVWLGSDFLGFPYQAYKSHSGLCLFGIWFEVGYLKLSTNPKNIFKSICKYLPLSKLFEQPGIRIIQIKYLQPGKKISKNIRKYPY